MSSTWVATNRRILIPTTLALLVALTAIYSLSQSPAAADGGTTASAVNVPTIEEILSGNSATGAELAAQLGLETRKVSDIQGPKAPADCYSFVGISSAADTKDIVGYCIDGLSDDTVHLYALGMALRDTIPSREEFDGMAENIRSGEAGDTGTNG